MKMKDERYLLFEIGETYINSIIYAHEKIMYSENIYIHFTYCPEEKYGITEEQLKVFLEIVNSIISKTKIDFYHVRMYGFEFWDKFDKAQLFELQNYIYVKLNLNLYIVKKDLKDFYLKNTPEGETILNGIVKQEFRSVVICGSFRKHIDDVKKVATYCKNKNIEVLSPKNLNVVDVYDDNFVLFHGEKIENERETYWIENKHTTSIEKADAILICNSNGYFGNTTIYEIGYAMACNKMIVFMNWEETDFDIRFPRNYGLL